jgi:hypothetical protein
VVGEACVAEGAGEKVTCGVGAGLDEDPQADKTRLTNKNVIKMRFIVRAFFQWPGAARIT